MSAKDRRGRGRRRPDAVGRWAAAGRPITPSAARRSSVAVVVRPSSRATGTPRSVITTSSPLRARSSHSLRCALRSVTATSTLESYTLTSINLYMKPRRAVCGCRVHSGCTPSGLFSGPLPRTVPLSKLLSDAIQHNRWKPVPRPPPCRQGEPQRHCPSARSRICRYRAVHRRNRRAIGPERDRPGSTGVPGLRHSPLDRRMSRPGFTMGHRGKGRDGLMC
jgi:hypothetical protein